MSNFVSHVTKISRKLRWQFRPNYCIPLHWHVGRPNFGDDANPRLFQVLGTKEKIKIRFSKQSELHFLGMGSILEKSNSNSIVLGSGFIRPPKKDVDIGYRSIVCVRGELSLDNLKLKKSCLLGDPMVMISLLLQRIEPEIDIGLVPHESNYLSYKSKYGKRFTVIDPRREPFETIKRISQCKSLISQSLHGLIVADAMEIPNLWLEPTDSILGGKYKFMDYFSTVSGDTRCLSINQLNEGDPSRSSYCVREFRFDKIHLLSALGEAIYNFQQ